MKQSTKIALGVAAGVVVLGYLAGRKAGDTVSAVGTGLNPASPDNYAYRGVNSVGAALTGQESFSLGSYLYDLTH